MVAVWTGLVFLVVAGCLTLLGVMSIRCRYRQRAMTSRYSMWAVIMREAPAGSTLAGFESDSRTLVQLGLGVGNCRENRGER